ncbi:hypothetical protein Glove_48g77 [Diversispora epigaea]|uniref:Uncharacterized protein n=1 Tax=Diversispora epigaea TaxID=1348612 RepID=A0A397JQ38_9GLOM|nr:hypothetical protein Glove_48g77 [Diversispora epigaea]
MKRKAFRWFLKSAEVGLKFEQSSLEYFYRNEILNVKKYQKKSNCLNILNNTCSYCKLREIPKWTSDNYDVEKLTANFQCRDKYILPILGITQDSLTKEYAIEIKSHYGKGFVNCDLHPGNLMITEIYNDLKYKFIRLGDLCRLANETSYHLEHIDVGIIMWIISTGKSPFAIRAYELLIQKLIKANLNVI